MVNFYNSVYNSTKEISDDKKKLRIKIIILVLFVLLIIEAIFVGVFVVKNNRGNSSTKKEELSVEKEESEKADNVDKATKKKEKKAEEKVAVKKGIEDPDGYILADSSTKKLTESDLAGLTAQELTYARNEVYARYGYVFQSPELNEYFATKSWYSANASFDGSLSATESANAEFIKNYQQTNNLTYTPRPQSTADGEYRVHGANITYFGLENGYLKCETESTKYGNWNFEGIGTIYGLADTTEYAEWGSDGKKYEIIDYNRMLHEITQDRNLFLDCVNHGGDYVSPPVIRFIIQGGKITEVRRYTP